MADCCSSAGNLAVEGFTLMIIFKNIFSFILTWYAYDWLIQGGMRFVLTIIASVQVVVCLLSVPLCTSLLSHAWLSADMAQMYGASAPEPSSTATTP